MGAQEKALAATQGVAISTQDLDRFLNNPSEYFDYSVNKMMGLSRAHLDRLHLLGLQRRFAHFRGRLAMMDKLAESQNIHAINNIEDVLPLLFGHEMFKSYPASFLDKHRYAQLTTWLGKLTTINVSKVDVSHCRSIDDWMIAISRETALAVCHTSGTSGSMSFLPWSKKEYRSWIAQFPVVLQAFVSPTIAEKLPLNIDCIYPYFRTGGLSHTVLNDAVMEVIAGSEDRFHAASPERLSADIMLFAAGRRVAEAKGQLGQLVIDPELDARRAEFEAQQRTAPAQIDKFMDTMRTQLAGRRIFMLASSPMLYNVAADGLKRGMRKIFAPNSMIITGGGNKGTVLPDNWLEMVTEFFGVDRIHYGYGMSEMAGQFMCCEQGHYHASPWVIPYVLDPDTAKPLPRTGTVTGRFGFYDLIPDTRWGGFVSGDQVTMEWDKSCACGRTTPFISDAIRRYSEIRTDEGEEKLSCAAAPDAYAEALDFLNDGS